MSLAEGRRSEVHVVAMRTDAIAIHVSDHMIAHVKSCFYPVVHGLSLIFVCFTVILYTYTLRICSNLHKEA